MTSLCVIVRHGNTFATDEQPRRIGSPTDLPLVESGREQALRLGKYFRERGWHFSRVLTSPLARTRETAALILSGQRSDVVIESAAWLAEIDHGPDENRSEDQIIARIGAEALVDWDVRGIAPPGWRIDAECRREAWRALFAAPLPGMSLLVTSNGAARIGLLSDNDLARQASKLPSLKLATGAFGVIALESGGPRLLVWNGCP